MMHVRYGPGIPDVAFVFIAAGTHGSGVGGLSYSYRRALSPDRVAWHVVRPEACRDGNDDQHHRQLCKRGERAEAEPAVPGWSMRIDELFPPP